MASTQVFMYLTLDGLNKIRKEIDQLDEYIAKETDVLKEEALKIYKTKKLDEMWRLLFNSYEPIIQDPLEESPAYREQITTGDPINTWCTTTSAQKGPTYGLGNY